MKKYKTAGIALAGCASVCLSAGAGATGYSRPNCNQDLEQTGARFVTYDKAAGHLNCSSIVGQFGKMTAVNVDANCGYAGCSVEAIDALQPFDAVVVGTKNQSCVYMFSDAVAAQSLKGPHNTIRFACWDGGTDSGEVAAEEPITSLYGGCSADADFDGIQTAVSQQEGIAWVFGVGDNAEENENDKTGLCVQGGANDIARCDEQCIVPKHSVDFPYSPDDPVCQSGELDIETGKVTFPLQCRPCALKEEVTPAEGAKTYCWERAAQRAVVNEAGDFEFANYFIPTSVKSTGSLVYSQFEGSTCYQVTTTYRGRVYTYWTPSGCP